MERPARVELRGALEVTPLTRRLGSGALLLLAPLCVVLAGHTTALEAEAAPTLFNYVGLGPARSLGNSRFLAMATGHDAVVFKLATQCGALLLAAPLAIVAGMVVRSPQSSARRVVGGVALGVVLLLLANQVRLMLIAYCSRSFGFRQGFPLGHYVVGSIWSLLGIAASLAVFLRVIGPTRRTPHRIPRV